MRYAWLPALAALAGCSVLHNPRGEQEVEAWTTARARWTRGGRIYDAFEIHALATALYESPEVRRRRAEVVAAYKAMTAEERARALAAEEAEAAMGEDFLLAFFTTDDRDNDLADRRSVWRVALVVDDVELLPAAIHIRKVDTLLLDLFPFIGEFDTVYRVHFPKARGGPLDTRRFVLRIAGSEGKMDFAFGPP